MHSQNALRFNAPTTSEVHFQMAIDSFYDRCEALNLSAGTLRFYRDKLLVLTKYFERESIAPTLDRLTADCIRDFLKKEVKRSSPASAKHCFTIMRALCNHFVKDGWIEASPMVGVDAPKAPKKIIPTFTEDQVTALLSTCDDSFYGLRDKAMLFLLVDCGLRAAELLAIQVEDIDLQDGRFVVLGKGAKEREIPFGQAAKTALREYLRCRDAVDGPLLFINHYGDPLTYSGLVQLIRRRETGKNPQNAAPPAYFPSHVCCYVLAQRGDVFSLQKLLGHADLTMTRRYVELSQTDVVERHRQYSPGDRFLGVTKPVLGRKRLR